MLVTMTMMKSETEEGSLVVTARVPGNQEEKIEGYEEEEDDGEDKDNDDIDNKDDDEDEKQVKFKEEEEDDDGKVKGQVTGKVKEAEQKSGQKKTK